MVLVGSGFVLLVRSRCGVFWMDFGRCGVVEWCVGGAEELVLGCVGGGWNVWTPG